MSQIESETRSGYQAFAGTSDRDRMEASPREWVFSRQVRGSRLPQVYVFVRSRRRDPPPTTSQMPVSAGIVPAFTVFERAAWSRSTWSAYALANDTIASSKRSFVPQ